MVRNDSRGHGYTCPIVAVQYSLAGTDVLRFPRTFTRCQDGMLPKWVHLRDRYDNDWTIRTRALENNMYILEGWRKFVEANFVKLRDIIIIRYDGDSFYDVKIFGLDGCEREGVGGQFISYDDDDDDDSRNREYSIEEETYKEEVAQRRPSERRKPMDSLRPDLFRSGKFEKPNNPYFVTRIRKRRCNELHVPCDTIQRFKLRLPRLIVLRDSTGRKWRAELRRWTCGRRLYVGGWKGLCVVNAITEQDLCICEFVRRRNGDIYLQIEFARGLA